MSTRRFMIAYRLGSTKKSRIPLGLLDDVTEEFSKTFSGLKWDSKKSAKSARDDFSIELGLEKDIVEHRSKGFPGFRKISDTKVKARAGYVIELGQNGDCVHQAIMQIGNVDLGALAALCKRQGWRLEDPDVADEEVDLDDPERWFLDHYG